MTTHSDERTVWFSHFGYRGDVEEKVILRSNLGTADAQIVWDVRQGLLKLQHDFPGQFHRVVGSAHRDTPPYDPAERLCLRDYGPLVIYLKHEWLPGRRAAVMALTDVDDEGMARLVDAPLAHAGAADAA